MTLRRIQLSAVAVVLFTLFLSSGVAQPTVSDAAVQNATTAKAANWTFEGCWTQFAAGPAAMCSETSRAISGSAASAAQLAIPAQVSVARSARRRSRAGSGVHRRSVKKENAPLSRGRGANGTVSKLRNGLLRGELFRESYSFAQSLATLTLLRAIANPQLCNDEFAAPSVLLASNIEKRAEEPSTFDSVDNSEDTERREQPSAPHSEDDCFCCCTHVLPALTTHPNGASDVI